MLNPFCQPRVRFRIRIFDPRSLGSWCIKGTDESLPRVDSSVPLIRHDPRDLGSKIRIRILPKKRTPSPQFVGAAALTALGTRLSIRTSLNRNELFGVPVLRIESFVFV